MSTTKFKILQSFGVHTIYKDDRSSLDQEFLIENILENPHFGDYPPSEAFQRSFWKWAIQRLEKEGEEVDERIYARYLELLPPSSAPDEGYIMPAPPSSSYATYLIEVPPESRNILDSPVSLELGPPGVFSITLMESRKTAEGGTTGFRTWQPSLLLGDWLLRNPLMTKGRILELGCGAGLLGLITASLQKSFVKQEERDFSVCMTDVEGSVLATCKQNVLLPANGLHHGPISSLSWRLLDWRDALPGAEGREALGESLRQINPTAVFGADLVYDLTIIPALAHVLSLLFDCLDLAPQVILAVTQRRQETIDLFVNAIDDMKMAVEIQDFAPLSKTVFSYQQNDVDKEADIKLVQVYRKTGARVS
ncbi:hypothetical protein CPB86DRAFT_755977 [Serendipita vermifera]|nr:hypothetical protein CPB86DRAFT_755977 [Serendipita vermifera]